MAASLRLLYKEAAGKSGPGTDMNRRGFILGLGVSAAFVGLAAAPASADGKRVALVIGNSAYKNVPGPIPPMTPARSRPHSSGSASR